MTAKTRWRLRAAQSLRAGHTHSMSVATTPLVPSRHGCVLPNLICTVRNLWLAEELSCLSPIFVGVLHKRKREQLERFQLLKSECKIEFYLDEYCGMRE